MHTQPGDYVMSQLGRRVSNGGLSQHEVTDLAIRPLVVGHDTTANKIALGAPALQQDPSLHMGKTERIG